MDSNRQNEGDLRNFLQIGAEVGALPNSEVMYADIATQSFLIMDATVPERGAINPIAPRYRDIVYNLIRPRCTETVGCPRIPAV